MLCSRQLECETCWSCRNMTRPGCRQGVILLILFFSQILKFHHSSVSKMHFYDEILRDCIRRYPGLELQNALNMLSSRQLECEICWNSRDHCTLNDNSTDAEIILIFSNTIKNSKIINIIILCYSAYRKIKDSDGSAVYLFFWYTKRTL